MLSNIENAGKKQFTTRPEVPDSTVGRVIGRESPVAKKKREDLISRFNTNTIEVRQVGKDIVTP